MNDIKEKMEMAYIKTFRIINKCFCLKKIEETKVAFEAFSGSVYGCNPKYISKKIHEIYGDKIRLVWAVKNPDHFYNYTKSDGIELCQYRSIQHIYQRMTAKVYISNFLEATEIPKRKGQYFIQTWHGGGCYKKLGSSEKKHQSIHDKRRNMQLDETDLFLVSSRFFENTVVRKQLGYKREIEKCGMPRNDCLFSIDLKSIRKIKTRLKIAEDAFVVLYAPTWSTNKDKLEKLNPSLISMAFEKKFKKKCVILFRAHPNDKSNSDRMIDVSDYDDMQELLCISDALITDYSSSIWDFSFTYRPCFLFAVDAEWYTSNRGFCMPIDTWGFPVAKSNLELVKNIDSYSQSEFVEAMKQHHKVLESYEDGKASERVAKIVGKTCGLEKEY